LATLQGTRDIRCTGELSDSDLSADCSQRIGTFIFAPDKRANWQIALAKHLHYGATNRAKAACRPCDKNGMIHRHEC
jgi:hypothetical protein